MTRPDESNFVRKPSDRRTFLRKGVATAGAVGVGAALLSNGLLAFAEEGSGRLTTGDAAIRRFLAAADILETDLWQQYTNLGALAQPVVHLSFGFFIFFGLKIKYQHRRCMRIVSPFFGRNVIEKNGVTWEFGGSDSE